MVFSYHCWLMLQYHNSGIQNRISLFILLSQNPLPYVGAAMEHFNDHLTKLERANY